MSLAGAVDTGIQQSNKDELEIRAGSKTIATADVNGFNVAQGVVRNKRVISTKLQIKTDETAMVGGPITVDENGSIEITGNGILVIV